MRQLFLLMLLSVYAFSGSLLFCKSHYKATTKQLKKKSLAYMEEKAQALSQPELLRAIHATKVFSSKYKRTGISQKDFLQAAFYLETHLPDIKHSSQHYLKKKKTGLKNALEYDPKSGHTFIILDSKKAYIGHGAKKQVYKTIHYGKDPKVLARSEQSKPMPEEIQALKELQGLPGVMNAYAFTKHKHKKKKLYAVYSDFYKGTISDLCSKRELDLSNKLIIMSDLLQGLESLHSRNYVHRDLHAYNYLVFEENLSNGRKIIRAVIADLGRTIKITKAKNVRAQMTSRLCPPEGFNHKKLRGKDYFATDVYALGCILYRLHHHKFPKWQGDYLRSKILSPGKKKAMLIRKLNKATHNRREELFRNKQRQGSLTTKEDVELLILNMLNADASKRGTATEHRRSIQHILQRHG